MKVVYLVSLFSTGERWNSMICASMNAVNRVLSSQGYSPDKPNDSSEVTYWTNPKDSSQTAIVTCKPLIE